MRGESAPGTRWLVGTELDAATRATLVEDLVGDDGAHLTYLRVPFSSTDFSLDDHTFADVDPPAIDPTLSSFTLAPHEAHTLPLLAQLQAAQPALRVMGSAWSAPGWMKEGVDRTQRKGLIGGTLADEHLGTYARLLARAVAAYEARGVAVDAITMQNEPAHSPWDYPGMLLSPAQEAQLAAATAAALDEVGSAADVVVHDHNWDLAGRAHEVLSDPAAAVVDGVAFHCYGGEPEAQSVIHGAHPDVDVHLTECTGTIGRGDFASNLLWNVEVMGIRGIRNWATTVLLWNLALDERSGPRVGGCGDCRGVVTIDTATGTVTKNEEYYALAHLGRAFAPGAHRIESTAGAGPGALPNVAFVDPDGRRGLVVANAGADPAEVTVADGEQAFTTTLPARSVATFRWAPCEAACDPEPSSTSSSTSSSTGPAPTGPASTGPTSTGSSSTVSTSSASTSTASSSSPVVSDRPRVAVATPTFTG